MKYKLLIFPFLLLLTIVYLYIGASYTGAQDGTFGPICEKGVTCTPTQIPPPQPTLPVTGPMETTFAFLGLGGFFLLAGGSGFFSFYLVRKK